jgi:hypothetical protein
LLLAVIENSHKADERLDHLERGMDNILEKLDQIYQKMDK